MEQQTLELADDCRMMEEILQNRDVPLEVRLVYEGNKPRNSFIHTARREFNDMGFPLIHAQEIYSADHPITEDRTYRALNELVRLGKAKTYLLEGLIWYAWCFPRRRA